MLFIKYEMVKAMMHDSMWWLPSSTKYGHAKELEDRTVIINYGGNQCKQGSTCQYQWWSEKL